MAPPLSASLITIELSSRKLCIAFCCLFVIFDFVDRSTLFVVAELKQVRDASVRNTPCCEHFATCGRRKFKIFPFFKISTEEQTVRLAKEDFFIKLFNPKLNRK